MLIKLKKILSILLIEIGRILLEATYDIRLRSLVYDLELSGATVKICCDSNPYRRHKFYQKEVK